MVAAPLNQRRTQQRRKVAEIIGRTSYVTSDWGSRLALKSVDTTKTLYDFWDLFRRGKAKGYQFGGLFAEPITQILTSWVLGDTVGAQLAEGGDPANEFDPRTYTNALLKRFMSRIHGLLIHALTDLYALGDIYIVVNPDGSLSIPSPETVKRENDPRDYRRPVKYTITTKLDEVTITDEYRLDGRTVTVKATNTGNTEVTEYDNLIGRLPIVHFANDRGGNEIFGRPVYETLLPLFAQYDDLIAKMLAGAKLMGIPVPVWEGLKDINAAIEANAEPTDETYTDENNNSRTRVRISYDENATIFLGEGGSFRFASPTVGFTKDIESTLKTLFLLILEKTRIPEAVWGNELSSARATAGEQMKTFYAYIKSRRTMLEGEGSDDFLYAEANGGLHELVDIWLKTRRLTDPNVIVAPVVLNWTELNETEESLRLEWVKYLHGTGDMSGVTALELSGLVEDPLRETEQAQEEMTAKTDSFDKAMGEALKQTDSGETPNPDVSVAA